ncbi:UNKNOWN [Stylonychia lemnae]|uniref:Intimal thickness related receptor IRP domain-containing protein n=1 Tax=Stylonychia lemnae TaxID=5949 RepID=A0A078AMG5_STYLE|nr:UNKNOWN [Stylonychia lemnae]|eukprot:CDW82582.1 UNKNOWN [Stylonychia lemnae]
MDRSVYFTIYIFLFIMGVHSHEWGSKYTEIFDNKKPEKMESLNELFTALNQIKNFWFNTVVIHFCFEMRLVKHKYECTDLDEFKASRQRNYQLRNIVLGHIFMLLSINFIFQILDEEERKATQLQTHSYKITLISTSYMRFIFDLVLLVMIVMNFKFIFVDLVIKMIFTPLLVQKSYHWLHDYNVVYKFSFQSTMFFLQGSTLVYLFYFQSKLRETNDSNFRLELIERSDSRDTIFQYRFLKEDIRADSTESYNLTTQCSTNYNLNSTADYNSEIRTNTVIVRVNDQDQKQQDQLFYKKQDTYIKIAQSITLDEEITQNLSSQIKEQDGELPKILLSEGSDFQRFILYCMGFKLIPGY